MSDEISVVVSTKINGNLVYFELDTCTNRSVSSTSNIAKHPLSDGSVISDHMYKNPNTLQLSGKFSQAGRWSTGTDCYSQDYIKNNQDDSAWEAFVEGEGSELGKLGSDRLANVQTIFEYIQKKGLLCTVYMSRNGEAISFKKRENMALQNITWAERYNAMDYSFTFSEIIQPSIDTSSFEQIESLKDILYPDAEMPPVKTVSEVILGKQNVLEFVLATLVANGYINKKSIEVLRNTDGNPTIHTGKLISLIRDEAKKAVDLNLPENFWQWGGFIAASSVFGGPVGLIINIENIFETADAERSLIESNALSAIKGSIKLIVNAEDLFDEDGNLTKNPELLNSAQISLSDLNRLEDLCSDIQNAINNIFSDAYIYQISTNENDNSSRTCYLRVGSDLIYITIKPINNKWTFTILDGPDENAETVGPIYKQPLANITDCSLNENVMYVDSSRQYSLYLLGKNLAYRKNRARQATRATGIENATNLSECYFFVTKENIKEKCDALVTAFIKRLIDFGSEAEENNA